MIELVVLAALVIAAAYAWARAAEGRPPIWPVLLLLLGAVLVLLFLFGSG